MLQIKDIRKKYITGDLVQTALDGVSLNLRESELVAILGPSGSGKSTLLNVIGGLDQYDSGDLIINGISTRKYSDRDWDSYRNHTVGFVFQSYNLIPHQSVLSNVELALTISGIPKSQRRNRAIKALEDVGLGNQIHKKPNQMSGGQMQRVAIARALVNNPDILLADEPTGALDSETSVQIMDLLKEVAQDRLVVMVTHNPELALQYADRVVRVKDGKIIDDSNPYEIEDSAQVEPYHKNMGKASMSFFSALSLSFNNLKSKKARTLLTAFAGSIGIIGIAIIISLSAGFQKYIDRVQEDTLANYPLTIQSDSADMVSALLPIPGSHSGNEDTQKHTVEEQPVISKIFSHIGSNDLSSFKSYLNNHYPQIEHTLKAVQYGYGIRPRIYSSDPSEILQINPATLFKNMTGNDIISAIMDVDAFQELVDSRELLDSQYETLQGRWPEEYHELVIVLPSPDQMSDHVAYTLGLKDMESLQEMLDYVLNKQTDLPEEQPLRWSYDQLMDLTFQLVSVPDLYRYNGEYHIWEDMSTNSDYMKQILVNSEQLKVVGIVCPKEGSGATSLAPGIGYHPSLTQHIIKKASASQIVQSQLANKDIDVFSGEVFGSNGDQDKLNFENMISVDKDAISSAFGMDISENAIVHMLEEYLNKIVSAFDIDTTSASRAFISTLSDFSRQMLQQYVSDYGDVDGNVRLYMSDVGPMVDRYLQSDQAQARIQELSEKYSATTETYVQIYKPLMMGLVSNYIAENAVINPDPVIPSTASAAEAPAEEEPAAVLTDTTPTSHINMPQNEMNEESQSESTESTTMPDRQEPELPTLPTEPVELCAILNLSSIDNMVQDYISSPVVEGTAAVMSKIMMQSVIMEHLSQEVSGFSDIIARYFDQYFYVDQDKLAGAFQFNVDEDELRRVFDAMSSKNQKKSAEGNLTMLGYADLNQPVSISIYMKDFEGKEEFLTFLDTYNDNMENIGHEEQIIQYTDMTGMMMSSVRTIIKSISYVLIAFVAVSLLVSSIMIGIITYISVIERTKEIGVLRAIGASKRNIFQVFNAETFIIGLGSGLIGIGVTLLLLIPGNKIIHTVMNNTAITAQLPLVGAIVLVLISVLLTLLGGLIPSRQAARKDPVIALRSE